MVMVCQGKSRKGEFQFEIFTIYLFTFNYDYYTNVMLPKLFIAVLNFNTVLVLKKNLEF